MREREGGEGEGGGRDEGGYLITSQPYFLSF